MKLSLMKSVLLLGSAVLALSACSGTKGPGEIGSKDDIVVRNHGMPRPQEEVPVAAVIPPASQPSETAPPPAMEMFPGDAPATPTKVVSEPLPAATQTPAQTTPPPVYPKPAAPVVAPPPVAAPVVTKPAPYPLDKNAPYSPKAVAAANEAVAAKVAVTKDESEPVSVTVPVTPPSPPAVNPQAPAPVVVPPKAIEPMKKEVIAPPRAEVSKAMPEPVSKKPEKIMADTAKPVSVVEPKIMTPVETPAPTLTPVAPPPVPEPQKSTINFSDPALIRSAQAAMKLKGAYKGAENGVVGSAFLNDLIVYQQSNKLPLGGLNEATLRHLGVIE